MTPLIEALIGFGYLLVGCGYLMRVYSLYTSL